MNFPHSLKKNKKKTMKPIWVRLILRWPKVTEQPQTKLGGERHCDKTLFEFTASSLSNIFFLRCKIIKLTFLQCHNQTLHPIFLQWVSKPVVKANRYKTCTTSYMHELFFIDKLGDLNNYTINKMSTDKFAIIS